MQANDPLLPQIRPDVSAPKPPPQPQVIAPPSQPSITPLPQAMMSPPNTPKRKLPILPIVIAAVICVAVIGSAIFVFVTSNSKPNKPVTTNNSQSEVDEGKVSTGDVDAVDRKIDESLNNINDSSDFRSDDLTDQTLGL
jgi:hypothetical protein